MKSLVVCSDPRRGEQRSERRSCRGERRRLCSGERRRLQRRAGSAEIIAAGRVSGGEKAAVERVLLLLLLLCTCSGRYAGVCAAAARTSWKERSNFLRSPEAHWSCTRIKASSPPSSPPALLPLPVATCSQILSTPAVERKIDVMLLRWSLTEAVSPWAMAYEEKKSACSVKTMNADCAVLSVRSITCKAG